MIVVCSVSIVSSLSENGKEDKKNRLLSFGHKFSELGGTKVVIAYIGLCVCVYCVSSRDVFCWLGFYGLFEAGLLSPDMIVSLMNKWEFTARFSHIIANNPTVRVCGLVECRRVC